MNLQKVCEYLNKDREAHMAAHGKWHLDPGKLEAALKRGGLCVKKPASKLKVVGKFTLPDWTNHKAKKITGKVIQEHNGVSIMFTGHGTCAMSAGFGTPIFIENEKGVVSIYVWSDINEEDCTHEITLENARESKRVE
jgi:hypothetical protein